MLDFGRVPPKQKDIQVPCPFLDLEPSLDCQYTLTSEPNQSLWIRHGFDHDERRQNFEENKSHGSTFPMLSFPKDGSS